MTQALVRAPSPEEREYARYLAEVETRRRHAADLQADLAALHLTLGRFQAEYHVRVGALFVELDRVRLAIAEYERRIARLQAAPSSDPADIEHEIESEFRAQREEVHAEDEETRRYERAYAQEQERPRLDADTETDVRRLYRDLAKRYHPDLARTEDERHRRQVVMQRVNAAFQARDITVLQALEQEAEADDPTFDARPIGEKLVWAIREVARLDELIAALQTDLTATRATDTHQLWHRQESGEPILETLETDLTATIATDREHLAALIATYRHILDQRPS